MKTSLLIGWTTVDSKEVAESMARDMVEKRLAACVQIEEPVQSTYRWKGAVQSEREWRLMVKFAAPNSENLLKFIQKSHPYDVPEWVVVKADQVSPDYLQWILETNS